MQEAIFDLGTRLGLPACVAYDPRADGKRRMILLGERHVVIRRRLQGVKMHLAIPVESYRGIVIAREDAAGGILYRLSLVHRDPDLCVALTVSRDAAAITKAWRHWIALVADTSRPAPDAHSAAETSGSAAASLLRLGERASLGSGAFARGMAPSRQARRQRGRACTFRPPTVFRGEREIICYE